jgi:hypothetical protein
MSQKYVSRFMKGAAPSAPRTSEPAPAAPKEPARNRWGSPSELVNTSLPAKQAPKLAPVTLAAATVSLAPMCMKPQKAVANTSSMEDFPSLGGKPIAKPVVATKNNFAALSREWAAKAKEDEAKAKEEAAAEARLKQFRANELEKEAKEAFIARRINGSMTHIKSNKKIDEEDLKYMEDEKPFEEEPYSSDEPVDEVYEDEEEDEYGCDGVWDPRKHRDELY